MRRRTELALCILILLLAAWLRLYQLADLPPGWRDDEIVETVAHAGLVLNGQRPLYFTQAEGHEPLFHYLSAGWISLAGSSLFSVRLPSVFFGMLSLAGLYRVARAWFGAPVALLALAGLSVSFWGLMYARFKLRHVGQLIWMLLAFYQFGKATRFLPAAQPRRPGGQAWLAWALCGVFLALALHTYYAARGLPIILLAFGFYMALFHRPAFRAGWRPMALSLGLAAALCVPMAVAIAQTGEGEARLAVVGAPLQELLRGQPAYALRNTAETLGMFVFTGDPEFLYNIPFRPVFEPLGAALFAGGVALSAWRWRQPRYAFSLIWLLGGLAPAFVSIPSASLGHTITAQPAAYLFPALALSALGGRAAGLGRRAGPHWRPMAAGLLAAGFVLLTAVRDGRDYFIHWPALPEVRRLYRADLHAAAAALRGLPPGSSLAMSSASLHPADGPALALETPGLSLEPRLFNPARAWLFPEQDAPLLRLASAAGGAAFGRADLTPGAWYALEGTRLAPGAAPETALAADFENGWSFVGYRLEREAGTQTLALYTYWRMAASYSPPPLRPVDVLSAQALPLRIFSHVLNADGSLAAGDDRLDVDPATLRPGDVFVQLLRIERPPELPAGSYTLQVGLYDPASGARTPTLAGGDSLPLEVVDW